jgi:hypothetical protein
MAEQPATPTELPSPPDISHLVIEDDTPVDNFRSEKQQRLLTDIFYSSWGISQALVTAANVGVFSATCQRIGARRKTALI